jgi:hypothetical protein
VCLTKRLCRPRDIPCHKGQLLALLDALPATLDIEALTVDACQGSEFDYVLISPVRANPRMAIGFVAGAYARPHFGST